MKPGAPAQRTDTDGQTGNRELWSLLDRVKDPEIPVLSIVDLGILRDVNVAGDRVTVAITPTYSGCPAMGEIRGRIRAVLADAGFRSVRFETVLRPAWTTDWLSDEARTRLRRYGIAPPVGTPTTRCAERTPDPACPQCGSSDTRVISDFGSAPCKALHKCRACLEPFESFKCI